MGGVSGFAKRSAEQRANQKRIVWWDSGAAVAVSVGRGGSKTHCMVGCRGRRRRGRRERVFGERSSGLVRTGQKCRGLGVLDHGSSHAAGSGQQNIG